MKTLKLYERLELSVNNDISHAEFTYSDGTHEYAYPFEKQDFAFNYDEQGIEHIEKLDSSEKCIRFTPKKTGEMRVSLFAENRLIDKLRFDVIPSFDHGYIKPSPKNRHYFEYSDGAPFIPIGINMVYPTSYDILKENRYASEMYNGYIGVNQYRSWFRKASESGVNVARLWLGHDYFSSATQDGYVLKHEAFAKIDRVIEAAREYGIKLKLTIDKFHNFYYENEIKGTGYNAFLHSLFNTQLYVDGEPCKNMHEFLTNEKFMNAWLYKVGELAKRYSGDTAIFAVELWNEMNTVATDFETVLAWNEKYLPRVREMFPHNMVINSLGSLENERSVERYRNFCWDKTDFKQLHRYLDGGCAAEICRENIIDLLCDGVELLRSDEMPTVVAETGAVNNCHSGPFKYYSADDDGLIFADCVYTPFFAGCAGCGQIWHWDQRYVESKSLFKMFAPFAKLIEGIDVLCEDFEPCDLSNDDAHILLLVGKEHILGYVRNRSASWLHQLRDLKDVVLIDELELKVDVSGEIELVKIWNDDTTASLEGGTLTLKNVDKGLMFKIKRNR